ncbi:MAG: COX15/CtaA family protein [Gemmatimonadales bacterium]
MPDTFRRLACTAAALTYLLIVLGAWVRITGSGMGCGDDWPLCHGRLFPPLDDLGTLIEWTHRLVAALLSAVVVGLAGYAWWLGRATGNGQRETRAAYAAVTLLVIQVLLGAVTVKLALPHWTVVLHLATAMLLLAALVAAALGWRGRPDRPALVAAGLGLAAVLLGGMTAKLGAATACLGFPLCNGQIVPDGNYLQHVHWTHRLVAYAFAAYAAVWAARGGPRAAGPRVVLGLVLLQVTVAAVMVVSGLPRGLQALHVAVGTAIWAAVVIVALRRAPVP